MTSSLEYSCLYTKEITIGKPKKDTKSNINVILDTHKLLAWIEKGESTWNEWIDNKVLINLSICVMFIGKAVSTGDINVPLETLMLPGVSKDYKDPFTPRIQCFNCFQSNRSSSLPCLILQVCCLVFGDIRSTPNDHANPTITRANSWQGAKSIWKQLSVVSCCTNCTAIMKACYISKHPIYQAWDMLYTFLINQIGIPPPR